jgi:DNA-binding response OmpR family regulator
MKKKRILIVDDERAVRASMTMVLKSDNCEIDVAENGIQAIGYIDKISYDLIITDYSMPEMDGLELSRIITLKYPAIPVLMVTGNESVRDLLNGYNATFFPKPFKVIELQERVAGIINGMKAET